MRLSLVVAMDRNHLIGANGILPWRIPEDMKYFRNLTMGHTVIMGRKTHESIKKPLVGRRNIVLTRTKSAVGDICLTARSLDEALRMATGYEVFVVGGAEVYRQALPRANRIYATCIDHEFQGDTYFPEIDMNIWTEVSRYAGKRDLNNPYSYDFIVYERR